MRILWTVVVVAALGCACGGAKATVSTRASAVSTAPAGATLTVDRAQIEVSRVRLTPVNAPQQQSSGSSESEGEDEVGAGPFHLDLTGAELTGEVTHAFDISAPPGDYSRMKIRVHPDATNQKSIIIDGTFNGTAFTFSSSLDEDQEREGAFSIDASGSTNITLSFDTSRWFSDGQGGALDPSNAANQSRIESNVKASLEAFEDDDHDGSDDANESGSSH
jgi:hypothetical protein